MESYFHVGWELQKQERYNDAVHNFELALQDGDQKAKFHLNCMYTGQGIPKKETQWSWDQISLTDLEMNELLRCYLEREGCPYIQNNTGLLYIRYKKDDETGLKWYKLSADQGYLLAMCNLWRYYLGLKNYEEAHQWLLRAGSRGHIWSQYELGELYFKGYGVTRDYKIAYVWLLMAASQNNSSAEYSLGVLYHDGLGVDQDFEQAREWYLKSANKGHSRAQNNLGYLYNHGQGVPQNFEQAHKWYLQAANNGSYDLRNIQDLALVVKDSKLISKVIFMNKHYIYHTKNRVSTYNNMVAEGYLLPDWHKILYDLHIDRECAFNY